MNNLVSGTAAAVLLFGVTAHHVAAYHVPQFMFASSAPTLSRACTRTCSFGFRRVSGIRSRSIVGRQGRSQLQMSENKFELEGSIKIIYDILKYESGFTKREFVVTTDDIYPEDIKFELLKEKCSLLDEYSVGDQVKVSFNIRGREWQGKYFTNLQAWRLQKSGSAPRAMAGLGEMREWGMLPNSAFKPPAPQAAPQAAAPRSTVAAAAPPAWQAAAPAAPPAWQAGAPSAPPTWQAPAPAAQPAWQAGAPAAQPTWQPPAPAPAAQQAWQAPAPASPPAWQAAPAAASASHDALSLAWDDDVEF